MFWRLGSKAFFLGLALAFAAFPQDPSPKKAPTQILQIDLPWQKTEAAPVSDAERIGNTRKLLASDKQRLADLKKRIQQVEREFQRASERFNALDAQLNQAREKAEQSPSETKLQETVQDLERRRDAARDEFDLVIESRRRLEQQLKTLTEKISVEERALQFITGEKSLEEVTLKAEESAPTQANAVSQPDLAAPAPPTPLPTVPAAGGAPQPAAPPSTPTGDSGYDQRVADAQRELERKQDALRDAELLVQFIENALGVFQTDLANTREQAAAARNALERSQQTYDDLAKRLQQAGEGDADRREIAALEKQVQEAQQRLEERRAAAQRHEELAQAVQAQNEDLAATRANAIAELTAAKDEVEAASRRVGFLKSPFAPHRIWRWLLREGSQIIAILIAMAGVWGLCRVLARRVIKNLVVRGGRQGTPEEREERGETLRLAFQSIAGIFVITIGGLAVLDQFGIDVTVLVGGAAIFGMALAFGAQNLVRDYFHGVLILLENQYRVGNVIRVGDLAGLVEDMTLRMTVLRDLEGIAHFIPHSQITTVSNLTHSWSRVVFDIGVAYKENVDRVMNVLMRLADEMRQDPQFRRLIIDQPEMLGVDAFGDSAVVVKFLVKTRPLKQWEVKRELLRLIKNEFDRLGIEIPFPHRTIFHRDVPDGFHQDLERVTRAKEFEFVTTEGD